MSVLLGAVRAGRFDLALLPWTAGRQAWLVWLTRIPCRVGQADHLAYSFLFTHPVRVRSTRGDTESQWVDIQLDYARAIGCDASGLARASS
jgi:ADP-heptose:LPS heptosyltransferase